MSDIGLPDSVHELVHEYVKAKDIIRDMTSEKEALKKQIFILEAENRILKDQDVNK